MRPDMDDLARAGLCIEWNMMPWTKFIELKLVLIFFPLFFIIAKNKLLVYTENLHSFLWTNQMPRTVCNQQDGFNVIPE